MSSSVFFKHAKVGPGASNMHQYAATHQQCIYTYSFIKYNYLNELNTVRVQETLLKMKLIYQKHAKVYSVYPNINNTDFLLTK